MANQQSPNGPYAHQAHYPPPQQRQQQPQQNGMPIPPQQIKVNAAQGLAQTNEEIWMRIGGLSEALGESDGATQAYERALQHNHYSVPAMLAISCILRSKDQFTAAVEYLRSIIKIESSNGEVWSSLGHCYLMMDDLQQAYSAYQQALYHLPDPKEPKLWYGIGILYDRYGSLEHAEEAFSQVMMMEPNFDKANEIYFRLGIIYKQQQKYLQSLECFRYIVYDPPKPLSEEDIWFQVGHVHEQQKDYEAAKAAYTRVLERDPNHAKVLQQLGWLHHQSSTTYNSQEQAIEYLEKSVNSDQTDAQSWYLLGRCYMSQQKYPKAYEAYQQAVYRDGRNPTFWCSIGVLYYQINQYRDALDAYSRAIRLNPGISEVWYDLGTLYESCNNQTNDALDAYSRAADLDPNNVHIKARLALLKNSPANGLPNPAGAPVPQDVHPQAYQPGAIGIPPAPQFNGHHDRPTGPAPPPLAAGNNWGSNRLAEMQPSAQQMQHQPLNSYDQRDRPPPPGLLRQPSPLRHEQQRQYHEPPSRQPPLPHRGLSPSLIGPSTNQPPYPHGPQHHSHQSGPPQHMAQPSHPEPPRHSNGPLPSRSMHAPSNSAQNSLPPYARQPEQPSEARPHQHPATSPSEHFPRTPYDHHSNPVSRAGSAIVPHATLPASDASAREREERPASAAPPPKRLRDWEESPNANAKKPSTDEARTRLDEIKVQRSSPAEKIQTPPAQSPSTLRRGEEQQRPGSAYYPSEAAHHPPPALPPMQTTAQRSPVVAAAPPQEAQRPPPTSQPAPAVSYEPAARKMDVDENYDDSGDEKSATKLESSRSSPKASSANGGVMAAAAAPATAGGAAVEKDI